MFGLGQRFTKLCQLLFVEKALSGLDCITLDLACWVEPLCHEASRLCLGVKTAQEIEHVVCSTWGFFEGLVKCCNILMANIVGPQLAYAAWQEGTCFRLGRNVLIQQPTIVCQRTPFERARAQGNEIASKLRKSGHMAGLRAFNRGIKPLSLTLQ